MTESPYSQAFQEAAHAMLLLDPSGRIREANARMVVGLRLTREALIGRLLVELPFWPGLGATGDRMLALHAHAVAGDASRQPLAVPLFESTPRLIDLAVMPLRDPHGGVRWVLVEARAAAAAVLEPRGAGVGGDPTAMERMVAQVAHEINNPLAGIQNAFLLVRDAIPPDHPHARFADAIEREIGRIAAITRRLVATYRPREAMEGGAPIN